MQEQMPGSDRTQFQADDIVAELWTSLGMPCEPLASLRLPGNGYGLPSSFKVGPFAQATIAASALAATTIHAHRNKTITPQVTVSREHACAEFKSERLYILDRKRNEDPWGPIGGLHASKDGYVRIHDGFPHHRDGALKLLGLEMTASRDEVAEAVKLWNSVELEEAAIANGLVIAALRHLDEWEKLPQAQCLPDLPISVRKVKSALPGLPLRLGPGATKCLQGLRVLELSRVIAAPVAGKTLAAHGADVLWVTSPNLPTLPDTDVDVQRGKRAIQLDLTLPGDKIKLFELVRGADVFLQGYRPGALAGLGVSSAALYEVNPDLIIANLSAYGTEGPWALRRGFDSIVQTCSGMNVAEADRFGDGSPARPLPCQALDHGSGYLLATGIIAALYKRATGGGGYIVDVSLAGTMNYLCSLGQYEGKSGFNSQDFLKNEDAAEFMETRQTELGELTAVRHSAVIEGTEVGWDIVSHKPGIDTPKWLSND
jgi:hypothetical protein